MVHKACASGPRVHRAWVTRAAGGHGGKDCGERATGHIVVSRSRATTEPCRAVAVRHTMAPTNAAETIIAASMTAA